MSTDLDTNTDAKGDSAADLAVCIVCHASLRGDPVCRNCGREFPEKDGILHAIGELSGRNLVAAEFYNGAGWTRFRPWERLFLRLVGGAERARREILEHLDGHSERVLEVGSGDGDNVAFLPRGVEFYAADLARTQLEELARRYPEFRGRLALAEAERLPFASQTFDATYSIGGFNYFRDPGTALREMRRVTRPGGLVLVADERPDLKTFGLGHLLGFPAYDGWWMKRVGLPPSFVEMVLATEVDPDALLKTLSPSARRLRIWKGLGYLLVEPDPSRSPEA